MQGPAATLVDGVPTGNAIVAPANDADDYNLLLTQYQNLFNPPLAREFAMMSFEKSCQNEDETVVMWAARLRSYFRRLYPGLDPDDDDRLLYKFRAGLRHKMVEDEVRKRGVITLTVAIAAAQSAEVSLAKEIEVTNGVLPETLVKTIQAINRSEPFQGKCFVCGKDGHRQQDCRFLIEAKRNAESAGGKDRRSRGSRGGGGGAKKPYHKNEKKKESGN